MGIAESGFHVAHKECGRFLPRMGITESGSAHECGRFLPHMGIMGSGFRSMVSVLFVIMMRAVLKK